MERVHVNKQHDWCKTKLQEEINPQIIGERFGNYIKKAWEKMDLPLNISSGVGFVAPGLTNNVIQDEMYDNGYRRVRTREDVCALAKTYMLSQEELDCLRKKSGKFFVQVFPKEGENNLVVVNKKDNLIFVNVYGSRKEVNNRFDFLTANAENERVSKPAMNQIDWDDQKGKRNIFDAAVLKTETQMYKVLKFKKVA